MSHPPGNLVTVDREQLVKIVALWLATEADWSSLALELMDLGDPDAILRQRIDSEPSPALFDQDPHVLPLTEAENLVAHCEERGIHVLPVTHPDFPAQLRSIQEVPPLIFAHGQIRAQDTRSVAVVGTRRASDEGLEIAYKLARGMAEHDITVVSGLAEGIDTAAHKGALDANRRTVAVLGNGVEYTYPPSNRRLQERIPAEGGLLISQFRPTAAPAKNSFLIRNTITSGYAAATVVVEAPDKSGARSQAAHALRHGRPVILLDRTVQEAQWARKLADNPGVFVVTSYAELMTVTYELTQQASMTLDDVGSILATI